MRIAIINWNRRKIAGAETYLNSVIPELHHRGHQIAFLSESDEPVDREQIELPDQVPHWCVSEIGCRSALTALEAWKPDVIYAHGLTDPSFEAATIQVAPSIFFAHNYYGTCISGSKTFSSPTVRPCDRRFGRRCLLQFYPRRCGGLSPFTMWQQYQTQSKRLELLHQYKAIIVFSEHMRNEYRKYGLSAELAYDSLELGPPENDKFLTIEETSPFGDQHEATAAWRLLFLGRMETLKGGQLLLSALSELNGKIDRTLQVTFAGDGPDRAAWERDAQSLQSRALNIEFTGWLKQDDVDRLLADSDLLVLPSVWPEPFGLAVMEAGQRGIPVAAFAVGGIPHWLIDGVNGHLAPGDPPSAPGLAEAISKCLSDPGHYRQLRARAVEVASRFKLEGHLKILEKTFERVAANR